MKKTIVILFSLCSCVSPSMVGVRTDHFILCMGKKCKANPCKMKFMNKVLIILLNLAAFVSFGQTTPQDPVGNFSVGKQTISLDSFTFCSMRFKVPRDCDKRYQGNCCSFRDQPDQFGCNNGLGITWHYFPNEASAKSSFESITNQVQTQMKNAKRDTIACYLVGTEAKAYRLKCETKEGYKFTQIFTYGVVNGQAVIVQLTSDKKIKKNKIYPASYASNYKLERIISPWRCLHKSVAARKRNAKLNPVK